MSQEEFFKALTPFNYNKPKDFQDYVEQHGDRIDTIFRVADTDGQGAISFTQFFFFVLMIQTSDRVIESEFKKAGGTMNMLQFSKNLTAHRRKTQFGKKHDMLKRDEEDFLDTNRKMCMKIFDKKTEIDCDHYQDLRDAIQEQLWHYEFHQYDTDKNDTISAVDFSHSLLVYFPFQHFQTYQDHILNGGLHGGLKHDRVTFEEFVAFQYFLKERDMIINYVSNHGLIDMDNLQRLAEEFSEKNYFCRTRGIKISKAQMDAFLCTMDLDGNQVLDQEEVIGILNKRKEIGSGSLGGAKGKGIGKK